MESKSLQGETWRPFMNIEYLNKTEIFSHHKNTLAIMLVVFVWGSVAQKRVYHSIMVVTCETVEK